MTVTYFVIMLYSEFAEVNSELRITADQMFMVPPHVWRCTVSRLVTAVVVEAWICRAVDPEVCAPPTSPDRLTDRLHVVTLASELCLPR